MEKIKKWFFKTCPKSGRIVGVNQKNVMLKIFFPLFGLAALVWFLIRVIPKPNPYRLSLPTSGGADCFLVSCFYR